MVTSGEPHNEAALKAQKLAIQFFKAGNLRDALHEARKAAELDKNNAKLQNLAGAIALEAKDPAAAIEFLRHSIALNEHQSEPHFLLGNALMALQAYDEAINSYDYAVALNPLNTNAIVNLGLCFDKQLKYGKAERAFQRALDVTPQHPEANNAIANILIRKGQLEKAEEHARAAQSNDGSRVEYITNLAKTLRLQKKYEEATNVYRVALGTHPYDPTLLSELGSVLREQHLFKQAEEHYEYALKIAPRSPQILRSVSGYYQSIRNFEKAVDLCERFLELNPDDAGMLNNRAICLRDLGRFEEAEEAYLKCAELDNDSAYIYNNLGILAMETARPKESIEYYQTAVEKMPSYAGARSNMLFYMNYVDTISPEELFKEHQEWQRWHTEPNMAGTVFHDVTPDPERPIRIGYLSADLYGHAVSYFIEPALRHHDTEKFEIFCYASVTTPDGITERLKTYTNTWRSIAHLNDTEAADLIRSDKIDILVELGGHTAGHRLPIMALKPAPIQVTWIGYPNTTGLDTIDYRIVDNITDPEGIADQIHSETLLRLPHCFTCYNPQAGEVPFEGLPCENEGRITFGSFNNAAKISDTTIETWARILGRVENSRLVLKSVSLTDKGTQERLWEKFSAHGIPADRVEMYGRLSSTDHMNFYAKIDIGLDTFPYNGTTTSCEALLMNVPIVALLGNRHAARVTASLITQIGLSDLVANDTDEYIDIAEALATDRKRLAKARDKLRDRMLASPLCDQVGHTRDLEDAYRKIWQKWCADAEFRSEERKKAGYPPFAPYLPKARVLHGLGNASFVQFSKCLGVMTDVDMITDIHALGINIFSPMDQAQSRYNLFTEEEWRVLNVKKSTMDFIEAISRIHDRITERGRIMVMSDWCHLDYIAQPFLPVPTYNLHTIDRLKERFDVREIFITRHPLAQWISYCRETNVAEHISVEEFLRGYLHFAEAAVNGVFIRCEDFSKDPDKSLKLACSHLDIEFDPEYADNWMFNLNVTGDAESQTLEQRADETLSAPLPTKVDPDLMAQLEANANYSKILGLLGYQ